jgi:hypothetical protein
MNPLRLIPVLGIPGEYVTGVNAVPHYLLLPPPSPLPGPWGFLLLSDPGLLSLVLGVGLGVGVARRSGLELGVGSGVGVALCSGLELGLGAGAGLGVVDWTGAGIRARRSARTSSIDF